MKKKKMPTFLKVGTGVLTLSAVLLIGNVNSAFSESITGKSSKYLVKEYTVQESVIKTFDLDTNKLKPYFSRDIFDNDIATLNSDVRGKIADALAILTKENVFRVGDFKPMYFLEGNDKVSIAIKHSDGTISITEFDISKDKPIKSNHKVKEAK